MAFGDAGEYELLVRVQAGDERIEQELEPLMVFAPEVEDEEEPIPEVTGSGSVIVKLGIGQISYMVDELEPGTVTIQRTPD